MVEVMATNFGIEDGKLDSIIPYYALGQHSLIVWFRMTHSFHSLDIISWL